MPNRKAILETVKGTIKFELKETEAPITTKNFIDLTNKGFRNSTSALRIQISWIRTMLCSQVTEVQNVVSRIRKGDKILKATIQ